MPPSGGLQRSPPCGPCPPVIRASKAPSTRLLHLPPQQVGAIPGYNFVRKAASDFGWDWGPAFAPAGITGTVELRGHSSAVLTGKDTSVGARS